jgi:hypothetical protein
VVWLTIPFVHEFPQRIDQVRFADDRWRVKHWKTLQACYARAPHWSAAAPELEALFAAAWPRLADVTIASAELLLRAFGVATRVVRASALGVTGDKAELVLEICRAVGATRYLSGRTGASYLDAGRFAEAGVEIQVQSFTPRAYPRLRDVPAEEQRGISALDAWVTLGPEAPALLGESS